MNRDGNTRGRRLSGDHTAESWNAKYPAGTRVIWWPLWIPGDGLLPFTTRTRSEAWALDNGRAVVLVEGRSDAVPLYHLEVSPSNGEV